MMIFSPQIGNGELLKNSYNPFVSIIVPIYNTKLYLEQCLNSIISQTLENIEIVLVDDGSTDDSGNVCDVYARHDKRIKVVHKSNEGLSCARNDGIEVSTAPYIMFVDSDDWIESGFCKLPYEKAIELDADIVMFAYNKVFNDKRIIRAESTINEGLISESEALYYNSYYSCYAWGCLYKRELFENIKYPAGKIQEDVATTHKLIHAANKIYYVNSSLYNYRIGRSGSITLCHPIQGNHEVEAIIRNKIDDLCAWGYEGYTQKDAFTLLLMYGCKDPENEKLVKIVQNYQPPSVFDWKKKIMYRLVQISPDLFDFVCIALGKRRL